MELEGYSDLRQLAEGGMARVYKARQLSLNRIVAIKFLSAEYLWDDDAKTLFDQESLVIAQLNHPNIIHIIDRGLTEKGRPYFVMEYVQGNELSALMQEQKLTRDQKLNLLLQICKGMACAHKNGVIHRDIKPANILIDTEGHVRILDFGIALLAASGHSENVMGTPDYMSPEQFSAPDTVNHLSDIFSLGVVMYEMFMAELPTAHFDNLSSSMANLEQPLAELIEQCLSKNPAQRPPSADEIRMRLLKILQGAHIEKTEKDDADEVIGKIKDKFSLLDIIKNDKYGAVYLFENKANKNLLVIKKRINTNAGYQEAKTLSHIDHPNIVKILGTSKNNNTFIVVMQHLDGGNLQDRLSRSYSVEKFLPIAKQICNALKHAHKHKILHNNLRPSNILFDDNGQIKITDFGLDEHYKKHTDTVSWYQPYDEAYTAATRDIFSAGAIFYHMLTGMPVIFKNGKIQANTKFNKLDEKLQGLLINMMERDAPGHYHSFKKITPDLNSISIRQAVVKKVGVGNKKHKSRAPYIFLVFIMFNILMLGIFLYMKPQYIDIIKEFFSGLV